MWKPLSKGQGPRGCQSQAGKLVLSESVALAVDRKPCSSMGRGGGGGTEIPARKTALQVTAGCSNAHIFKSEYPPTEVTAHETKWPQSGDAPGRGGRTPTPGGYRGTDATRGRARRPTGGPRRGLGGPCHRRCRDSPGEGAGPRQRRRVSVGATANSGPLLRPEFQPLPTPAAAKHTQGHGRQDDCHLQTLLVPPGRAKGAKLPCGY